MRHWIGFSTVHWWVPLLFGVGVSGNWTGVQGRCHKKKSKICPASSTYKLHMHCLRARERHTHRERDRETLPAWRLEIGDWRLAPFHLRMCLALHALMPLHAVVRARGRIVLRAHERWMDTGITGTSIHWHKVTVVVLYCTSSGGWFPGYCSTISHTPIRLWNTSKASLYFTF